MAHLPFLPMEEFRAIIRHECARCDRNSHQFSLVLIAMENPNGHRYSNQFVKNIIRRMRTTDELGWFDEHNIGIFLPETTNSGAKKFIEETLADNNFKIYTYPSSFPHEIDKDDGNGRNRNFTDKGSGKSNPPDDIPKPNDPINNDNEPYIHHRESDRSLEEMLLGKNLPFMKRSIDIIGSFTGLIIFSPLFLLIAVYIKIVSPGPVFFKQERLGYLGKPFTMWKFRTMGYNADTEIHQKHLKELIQSGRTLDKLDQGKDNRIFLLSGIIRKTCIDELPQLINVLKGDMSLSGPRPCLLYEAEEFANWQNQRFHAFPGMTGLWQVNGKNRTTFKEMMRLDIRYSRTNSFWMDLMIFLKTGPVIIGQIGNAVAARYAPSHVGNVSSNPSRWGNLIRQLFL